MPWGLAATLTASCPSRAKDASPRLSASRSLSKAEWTGEVYPLGGKITVDNEPPWRSPEGRRRLGHRYDAAKPEVRQRAMHVPSQAEMGPFELPPLPPGQYVMLFAQLG